MKAIRLVSMSAAACFALAVKAEWTTNSYLAASWTASTKNMLLTATPGRSSYANFSDGKVTTAVEVRSGNVFTWTLKDPSTISGLNVYTYYGDAGRDGICISKVEFKVDGSGDWVESGIPAVEFATKNVDGGNIPHDGISGKMKALYTADGGGAIAEHVTAIRMTMGNQDNGYAHYGEIEFDGVSDKGWSFSIIGIPEEFATVSVSPSPSADGYFTNGTVASISVEPFENVEFLFWTGNVPAEQVSSASIQLTMDRNRNIRPVMEAPYFVFKNELLSDGGLLVNASKTGDEIYVKSSKTFYGAENILDLTLPIRDGGVITRVGNFQADSSTLTAVKLPPTLKTIDGMAFYAISALVSVTPFLPDSVTTIGGGAFVQSGNLKGDLRIGFGTNVVGDPVPVSLPYYDGTRSLAFKQTAVGPNVALGPGVTSVPAEMFMTVGTITNLYLGENIALIGYSAFDNLGKSKRADVVFAGDKPATISTSAFGGAKAQYLRFFLPMRYRSRHPAWYAFVTDPAKVTPWKELTDAQRTAYWAAYPRAAGDRSRPYGLTLAGAAADGIPADQWIFCGVDEALILMLD